MRDKFIYTKMPVPFNSSAYDRAREWAIGFFSKVNNVLAVYEYGTVTSPGLSDLDLIVVLKDKPEVKGLYNNLTLKDIPGQLSLLINNSSIKFISRKHFKDIKFLGEFKNRLLCGEEIKLNKIPSEQANLVKVASIMDFLPERVLSLFEYRESKKAPATDLIGLYSSYLYSAKETEGILGKQLKEVDEFEKELNDLRRAWFEKSYSQQTEFLSCLMDRAIFSGIKAIEELTAFLTEQKHYLPVECANGAVFYFNKKKGLCFYTDSKNMQMNMEKHFFSKGSNDERSILFLVPAIWLVHFYFYGKHKGIIGFKIRNNFVLKEKVGHIKIGMEMSKALARRIALCNEMAAFFEKYDIPMNKLYRFAHIQSIKKDGRFLR